ncbi:MAG TPA: PAS domain-containing protein, partial [Verrucomicrobiae bacterium]|nr:PAS domain-containing protein [Verrucomicrobiae bacterium]
MNPGPVLRLDSAGRVLLANKAARAVFGEGVVGNSWLKICPGLDQDKWRRIVESAESMPVESASGGREFVFVHRSDREAAAVFVFGSDVTDLKQAQRTLSEVARFPDMNPGPVLRLDRDGVVLLANRAARAIFGDGVVGSSWQTLCPEISAQQWQRILESSAAVAVESTSAGCDFVYTHRSDMEAGVVFVFGSDVTDLKQAQRTLREVARFPDMNP